MTLKYDGVELVGDCLMVLDEAEGVPDGTGDKLLTMFKYRVRIDNLTYYTMDKPYMKEEGKRHG